MLYIHLFVSSLIIGLEFMMTSKKKSKQKIMTKIKKKKNSLGNLATHESVVCVASKHFPHQKMNSIPFPMPLVMPQEMSMLFHYVYISLSGV